MPVPDPPPSYTPTQAPGSPSTNVDSAPPAYVFPSRYEVGGKVTERPLVDIASLKGHLALLNAFARLKEKVEAATFDRVLHVPQDGEAKWSWFVGLAAERFDRWCLSLSPKAALLPIEEVLPPLDVLMVWHSYMLNPRWYEEDRQRIPASAQLHALGDVLGKELHRLPTLLDAPASEDRMFTFYQRVLLPYDPFESAVVSVEKKIKCPKCRMDIVVPFLTADGTGYLQAGFITGCPRKGCMIITKESLCARKLAENLSREGQTPDTYLPGTYFTESYAKTQRTSCDLVTHARSTFLLSLGPRPSSGINDELCLKILKDAKFSTPVLRGKLGLDKLIGRIMSAHSSPMVYSVDLVGAVLRQGSFVQKMDSLGWTRPGFFDARDDERALQHALARYHAFLDLLASSPASFFVPTLDIDLVWHTHQLASARYKEDCSTYVGRFVDHDDKADAIRLSSAFDLTCRAWKDRFGVRYNHCGCPLPGDKIGQRLSRLISSTSSKSACSLDEPNSPSMLIPPPDRPDLVAATHASEHNSIQFVSRNDLAHRKAETFWRDHESKMAKRVKKQEQDRKRKKSDQDVRYWWTMEALVEMVMVYVVVVDAARMVAEAKDVVEDAVEAGDAVGEEDVEEGAVEAECPRTS